MPFHIHMTYRGQTTTGHLPRWLGDDGNITYATRIPHIIVKTTETGGFTFQETQTLYSTFRSLEVVGRPESIVGETTKGAGEVEKETQSCVPDAGDVYVEEQKQKEIVAGSVIGGFMLLVIVVFAVGVLVAWRRKVKGEQKRKGDGGVELMEVESGEELRAQERRIA
jgi:hypothetical protein